MLNLVFYHGEYRAEDQGIRGLEELKKMNIEHRMMKSLSLC
ncbi:MAG: hypothetical protein ACNYWU_14125 [Desulfobacterales bacterium]